MGSSHLRGDISEVCVCSCSIKKDLMLNLYAIVLRHLHFFRFCVLISGEMISWCSYPRDMPVTQRYYHFFQVTRSHCSDAWGISFTSDNSRLLNLMENFTKHNATWYQIISNKCSLTFYKFTQTSKSQNKEVKYVKKSITKKKKSQYKNNNHIIIWPLANIICQYQHQKHWNHVHSCVRAGQGTEDEASGHKAFKCVVKSLIKNRKTSLTSTTEAKSSTTAEFVTCKCIKTLYFIDILGACKCGTS